MKIVFIRHVEKEETGGDSCLTKKGIKQAKHLAHRLKKEKFEEFYCSDMIRAKQTAEIVSKIIKMKPIVEKSLNEFNSELLVKNKDRWILKEKQRYLDLIFFLKNITKKPNDPKSVLIIAHGITNRIILSYFLNLNLKRTIPFRQSEGAINFIYWAEKFKNWRLKVWNDNNHIPFKLRYK